MNTVVRNSRDAALIRLDDLVWKGRVKAATNVALPANTRTGNVLIADANGAFPTVDGVTINTNGTAGLNDGTEAGSDKMLVKDEATGANNGKFFLSDPGSASKKWRLARTSEANASSEVTAGFYVFVDQGTANPNSTFVLTTDDPITLNTTSLTFAKFSGLGQIVAGTGMTKTGDTLNVIGGDGIVANADDIAVDFNTTNLKITAGQINTIQNIDTTASPTFEGLNILEGNTDTVPAFEIKQTSTGDAALQFSIVGDAYAIGIDNTDDRFKISYASTSGAAVLGVNDRFAIDSAGKIGIGTTNPGSLLHMKSSGNIAFQVETTGTTSRTSISLLNNTILTDIFFMRNWGTSASGTSFGISDANLGIIQKEGDGNLAIGTIGTGFLVLGTNNTERMRIDSNGLVGIGITPTVNFHISGTGTVSEIIASTTTTGNSRILLHNTTGVTDQFVLQNLGTATAGTSFGLSNNNLAVLSKSGNENMAIGTFGTGVLVFGTNNTEAIRIDPNGNVGIGTNDPKTKLHIETGRLTINDGSAFELMANGTFLGGEFDRFLNTGTAGRIEFINSAEEWRIQTAPSGTAGDIINDYTTRLFIRNTDVTIPTQLNVDNIRIDGNTISSTNTDGDILLIPDGTGNIGIGVTDPDAKLEINGQIKITGGTPVAGYALKTDADGLATWEAVTAGAAGADGAIQFATSGSLNSDVANISFDNSLNVFTLGKTTSGQVAEIGNAIFRNRNADDFSLKHKLFTDNDIDDLVGFGHNLGGKITIGATLDNTIDFLTGDGIVEPTLKMVILGNGNLGIGTGTPDELTHISKAVDGIFTGLLIENSQAAVGSSTNETAEIKFGFGGNNDVARISADKLKDYTSGANEDSRISFWVDDAGTLTEIAHIMPDGLMLMLPDPKIRFAATTGGGGSIQYKDLSGSNRSAFLLAGNNVVAVTSRGANGTVEIRANTSTGGNGGEVTVATFQDDGITFLSSGGNVGIGTSTPATSAILDVVSTTGAILFPRMTTTQRDALTELAGMVIFNTTTTAFEGYNGTSWNAL